ncbi:MAG: response regulator [Clostridia bacterium]|jgi:two-component system, response regulator YesN|nr:response regulator [Clostridia bacterium]MBT7122524.1 response regulator [Clostridia bacterium]
MHNLLVVDDEPIVRKGIVRSLNKAALNIAEVYEAQNGQEALKIVQERDIDLILADINMPKMNGLDFAKAAKAENADVKIAMVTGYDYFDYAVSALRAGVDEYVLKPVSKSDIAAVLRKLIDSREDSSVREELSSLDAQQALQDEQSYKKLIQATLEEELQKSSFSLSVLADKVGLSTGYLSRLFKQNFNMPFRNYLLLQRINKAKILLIGSEMKIYEVCFAVGFEDPNYFSAMFKRETGYTPSGYRKHVKNK